MHKFTPTRPCSCHSCHSDLFSDYGQCAVRSEWTDVQNNLYSCYCLCSSSTKKSAYSSVFPLFAFFVFSSPAPSLCDLPSGRLWDGIVDQCEGNWKCDCIRLGIQVRLSMKVLNEEFLSPMEQTSLELFSFSCFLQISNVRWSCLKKNEFYRFLIFALSIFLYKIFTKSLILF